MRVLVSNVDPVAEVVDGTGLDVVGPPDLIQHLKNQAVTAVTFQTRRKTTQTEKSAQSGTKITNVEIRVV